MSPTLRAAIALVLMVGFYVLAVGSGVGLLAIAVIVLMAKNVGAIKLAFLAAVAGGSVLWSVRPRVDRFEPPGPPLTRETEPDLFGVMEDVARAAKQAMPSHVYAIPDVNASVSTRGGMLGVGGHRVMLLGLPLLYLLTVDQLKAVLAHEFGHYGGGDTRVGRLVYHTRMGLARTLEAVHGKTISIVFNAYARVVMRVSTAVARQQEFAADRFAARVTSPQDLASSLQRLDKLSLLFPVFYASNIHPLAEEGYWPPIGQGFAAFCALPVFMDATVRLKTDDPSGVDEAGRYDSHPPTEARVAALQAIGSKEALSGPLAPSTGM